MFMAFYGIILLLIGAMYTYDGVTRILYAVLTAIKKRSEKKE